MSFIANLSRLMDERGVNQSDLARALDVEPQAVSQWFKRNGTTPRSFRYQLIADFLGVTVADLLAAPGRAGRMDETKPGTRPQRWREAVLTIEELDVRAMGGGGAETPDLDAEGAHPIVAQWGIPADYLRAFAPAPAAVKIVRVVGDSMEPEYPAGDRVLVDTSHRTPSPPGVYVVWDGFGLVLKRLEVVLGSEPCMVRLSSSNPAYPPYERPVSEVVVQGRVMGKWVWK